MISDIRDEKHFIEPIKILEKNQNTIKEDLIKAILQLNGEITENSFEYIKVSFKSKVFRFEDIAEFKIDRDKKNIEVKSAAQSGYYDFEMNRKRIEKIRLELER